MSDTPDPPLLQATVTIEYPDGPKIEIECEYDPATNTIVIPAHDVPITLRSTCDDGGRCSASHS
jgi:hypothetical protein